MAYNNADAARHIADAPPTESVATRVDQLNRSLDGAFETVEAIERRLDHVLTPVPPTNPSAAGTCLNTVQPSRSLLVDQVDTVQNRVFTLRERLSSLMQRIEV